MENIKNGFEKKAAELKDKVSKNQNSSEKLEYQTINEKICPFMSDSRGQIACTPQCKIQRADKKGFECIFSELAPISWNLKN